MPFYACSHRRMFAAMQPTCIVTSTAPPNGPIPPPFHMQAAKGLAFMHLQPTDGILRPYRAMGAQSPGVISETRPRTSVSPQPWFMTFVISTFPIHS